MFGEKIKMLRKSQGLTQAEFAKRLFVTSAAVSQWETDVTRPDMERLIKIAKEFSVPLDYFSDDPATDYSETELIKQHLLIELGASQPKTNEAKILAAGIDKLPKEQREMALNVMKAMFAKYADYFEEGDQNDTELRESGDQGN